MKILKVLKELEDFECLKAANEEEIKKAENELELKFSKEYTTYLKEFSLVSGDGHEFTGICKSKRLNVADVTKKEWDKNDLIPRSLYVIERLDIDGIVIWQDCKGTVYESIPNKKPKKIYNSLSEYILDSK